MDTTSTTTDTNLTPSELSSELLINKVEDEHLLVQPDLNQVNTSTQSLLPPPAPWQTSFSSSFTTDEEEKRQDYDQELIEEEEEEGIQTPHAQLDDIENHVYNQDNNIEEQEGSEPLLLETSALSSSPLPSSTFAPVTSPTLLASLPSDLSSTSSGSSLSSPSTLHPWNTPSLPSKPSLSSSSSSSTPNLVLTTNGNPASRLPRLDPSNTSMDTSMIHPSRRPWFTNPSNPSTHPISSLSSSSSHSSTMYPNPSPTSSYRPNSYYRSSTSTLSLPPSSSSSSSYHSMYPNRTLVHPATHAPSPSTTTSSSYYRPSMYTSSTPYAYATTPTSSYPFASPSSFSPSTSSSFASYSFYPSSSTSSTSLTTLPSQLQKPPSTSHLTQKRSTKSMSSHHHGHYFDMQQYQDEVNQRKAQEKLYGVVEKKRKVTKKEIAQFKAKKLDQKKKKFMAKYTEM